MTLGFRRAMETRIEDAYYLLQTWEKSNMAIDIHEETNLAPYEAHVSWVKQYGVSDHLHSHLY